MRIAIEWGFNFELSMKGTVWRSSFGSLSKTRKPKRIEPTTLSRHLRNDLGLEESTPMKSDYYTYL